MTPIVDLSAILALPVEQRRAVFDAIGETLPEFQTGQHLSEELKRELDRRIQNCEDDPEGGVPWDEVKTRLLARRKP